MTLHPVDLAIIAVYVLAMVGLGVWLGQRGRTLRGYFLADREMAWPIVTLSIVATETSTATLISIPGYAFQTGGNLGFLQIALGFIVGRLLVCALFVPAYFRGELFTSYQVLQKRFGGSVKEVASCLFLVTRNVADGLRLYLTALVVREVLASYMGDDTIWPFAIAVVVTGLSTIVYTFLGGIRAVFWMDAIQFVVYMAGAVVALVLLINALDGHLMQYISIGSSYDKFRVLDFSWDLTVRDTFWAGLIGGALLTMATHGTDQLMVQRYLAARSPRDAKLSLALSGFVVLGQFALVLLLGVALFVFYKQVDSEMLSMKSDYVFPRFIVDHMPLGVRGLLLAAIFSAAMSTLSSSLNSSSAALVSDFYRPRIRPGADDAHYFRAGRWFTIGFGLVQMGVAFAGLGLSGPVVDSVLAIAGFTTGIVLGVFFLGRLTRRVDARAALIGLIVGAAVMTVVSFGPKLWESLPAIAWPWYALIGSTVTFAAGVLASVFGARGNNDVNQRVTE